MRIFPVLLLLLIAMPLAEVYVLISVGRSIGALETVVVIVVTAAIGAWLLRIQGLTTVARLQTTLGRGEMPAAELLEGLLLLVTAALLLTPGFITDAVGFVCLIPQVRQRLAGQLLAVFMRHAQIRAAVHGRIITGEFRDVDQDKRR